MGAKQTFFAIFRWTNKGRFIILILTTSLFLFTLCLIGCAPAVYVISDSKTSGSLGSKTTLVIEDMRPESDKDRSLGSILFTSASYGITTLGDKQFEPTIIELLRQTIGQTISKVKDQPVMIKIKLNRLIVQANQQAYLLESVSSSQSAFHSSLAQAMRGQEFEKDINKKQPYVYGFIESSITVQYEDNREYSKKISLSKAENFNSHIDEEGRKRASINVVKSILNDFSTSIYSK